MEAIEIARKLAELGSAEEARAAYELTLHQGGDPAERLEAAAYILQTGGDYKISYTCFCELYNQGYFQEEILPVMLGAFYEPNVKTLQSRYEQNCKLLRRYPYFFQKKFIPFDELPVIFFPYDDDSYLPFYPDRRRFGDYINFKNPVVDRNYFRDLEKPVLADDVYSQYELEYLYDNVRRSEDIGRENHVYLHYTEWDVFCAHLQCLDFHRLLKNEKLVFLIGDEIRRYPIDFKAEYGVDYSRYPLKPVGIREVNRLIWHAQLSAHNGGDFFNEVFDAHPNLLVLSSVMMTELKNSVNDMEEKLNRAKSLKEALELFSDWENPSRVEELYRLKKRTGKDIMTAVFLENKLSTAGLDRASRIVPAVFLQPHFARMLYSFYVDKETGAAVLESADYEETRTSPLIQGFQYIKTFTPMRRFTTSYGGSMRFMEYSVRMGDEQNNEKGNERHVVNDLISDYMSNRSYMIDPEERLYKDSVLVRFEDAKLNPKATFTALAAFLDIPYTQSMTSCTEGGVDYCIPGNTKGFDTASVYKTYDEFINDSERCYLEYFLRDAYENYGYDFQYYDGGPMDEARAKQLIEGFTKLDGFIRWSMEKVVGDLNMTEEGKPASQENAELIRKVMIEDYMNTIKENRLNITRILMRGFHFVNKRGQPLQMMKKLEPDPALLERPLYH